MRFAPQTIPASGASVFSTAESWAPSSLVPCESESRGTAGWLPGGTTISTSSLRRLVHNAG